MKTKRYDDLSLSYVISVPESAADDSDLPLMIVCHGRGADANDLSGIAPELGGPYRFVFPNAPKPFEPSPGMTFGFTWFDGWPPKKSAIAETRQLLLRFIDEVTGRYRTPEGKLIISGFSQGALMSLDVGFRTAKKVAGIAVMSGAIYEDDMADLRARKETPVLIVHGTEDEMIPVIAARRTRRVLEEHGLNPEYHEFPMGHWVTPESLAVVGDFVRRCLA